ncbi:plasmid pRiA4b ORF-3 family protein [Rhodococcus sp. B10]|uniref:plasmid pRiA4b ORF-3 family protein n=1 Tax=Rhodococcus sp. B10 TaxID=2695876 RepID=UPI00143110AE|nr:plasmid pRiA4b ORF-3 family protein [Rhodococcus sp. B10]
MPNRSGRARHLWVVPDLPDDSSSRSTVAELAGPAARTGRPLRDAQFVLRVTLRDGEPAVWRRIRVRSDLLLPELHTVLQTAMGWSGRRTHCFSGHPMVDDDTAHGHLRIDAVLAEVGASLDYTYDARGGQVHTVELEDIVFHVDDPRSRCLDGRNVCLPEDRDDSVDVAAFDRGAVDLRMRALSMSRSVDTESAAESPLVARLLRRLRATDVPQLTALLPRRELTIESSVDIPLAEIAMSKLAWFLHRVGERGVELTGAGYLPPSLVEAIRDELDWGIGWHGTSLREVDHHQVTDLRDAARSLGLVRVLKGTLVRTKAGTHLADDHVGLWQHCVARLPIGREAQEKDAGTLFLIALASSASARHRDELATHAMAALGWAMDARIAGQRTVAFLDLIGAHGPMYYLGRTDVDAPQWARRFARDALRSSTR